MYARNRNHSSSTIMHKSRSLVQRTEILHNFMLHLSGTVLQRHFFENRAPVQFIEALACKDQPPTMRIHEEVWMHYRHQQGDRHQQGLTSNCAHIEKCFLVVPPRVWEDPRNRTSNSGLYYSYGVDYRALRWSNFVDPSGALGTWKLPAIPPCQAAGPCPMWL